MKAIVVVFFMFWFSDFQSKSIYKFQIDSSLTKSKLENLIEEAKRNGVILKVLYASYKDSGLLKVIQIAVLSDGFSGMATQEFKNSSDCVSITRDFQKGSKIPFGISGCSSLNLPEKK
jgi:hypothetical protein